MEYKEILKITGIEFLWLPREYGKKGTFIAKCPEFPNGAIGVRIDVPENSIEFVSLHEIGHLVSGESLSKVNARLKQLEHCKNEAKSNRFLMHSIVLKFVEENDYNPAWATPYKLCDILELPNTSENIWIAEQEIDYAFWGEC